MVDEFQGATRQAGLGQPLECERGKTRVQRSRKHGSQGKSRGTSGPGCLVRGAANDAKLYPAAKVEGRGEKWIWAPLSTFRR